MSSASTFQPTPAQRRLLNFAVATPGIYNPRDCCKRAGIDVSGYYKWCHDPKFRLWFLQQWSAALLFEGWHVLNVARAHMYSKAWAFNAVFKILFDPRGQASLAAWQNLAAASAGGVDCDVEEDQQLGPENSRPAQPRVPLPLLLTVHCSLRAFPPRRSELQPGPAAWREIPPPSNP